MVYLRRLHRSLCNLLQPFHEVKHWMTEPSDSPGAANSSEKKKGKMGRLGRGAGYCKESLREQNSGWGEAKPEMRVRLSIWSSVECRKQSANKISHSVLDWRRGTSQNGGVSLDSQIIAILKEISSHGCAAGLFLMTLDWCHHMEVITQIKRVFLLIVSRQSCFCWTDHVYFQSFVTCWSIATASRPWYIMLTQPSFEASTNRDMRA